MPRVFLNRPTCERSLRYGKISGLTQSENVCKALKDDLPMLFLTKSHANTDIAGKEATANTP
ncbi:hypothetical protein ELH73_02485 [Rhizobium leguminosarum]|nr:hypothetical protein ELI28_02480 [Rhizobium leguminosarum]TAV77057.1 hypothetical protein ELI27_02480 [Rhizobium leguminosarum]TAZ28805.1 hypothetical protein ELH73_02485 [Rhizobium leguminosarum]